MFKNYFKIKFISGNGGNSSICKFIKRNKKFLLPGAKGGDGGDIYIYCDYNLNFLSSYFYKDFYKSDNGIDGNCKRNYIKNSKKIIIRIPYMSKIIDYNRNITLFKCIRNKTLFLLCKGGEGKKYVKNIKEKNFSILNLYKTKGEIKIIKINFKFFINIIFIGYPNTGKTSFLNNNFFYNLKFSNYKYTTILPNLISIKLYKKKISIIDIPGLIKNTFTNYSNLYFNFLKNLNELKLIFHFIDISILNINFYLFIKYFNYINFLLYKYNKKFFYKFRIIILNKCDLLSFIHIKNLIKKILINFRWYNIIFYSSFYFNSIKFLLNYFIINF